VTRIGGADLAWRSAMAMPAPAEKFTDVVSRS
jgi:hypothetical protein